MDKSNTDFIRSCPFCGSKATFISSESNEEIFKYFVSCDDCSASIYWFEDKQEAIKAWNRRVPPLQKWEPGSKPPDGWYAAMFPNPMYPHRVIRMKNGQYEQQGVLGDLKEIFDIDGVMWGPIPEPEVEG
jgi:Lar family restriction alleviation protein